MKLELHSEMGGVSLSAPPDPKIGIQSLPPTLRNPKHNPALRGSKAPRGLFVLVQEIRVFTDTSISPGRWSRQCSSRYAFRAGRQLSGKGLRYHRTVRVTAAVHRGFGSQLIPINRESLIPLTFRHWAGVSPYTSPYGLSRDLCF